MKKVFTLALFLLAGMTMSSVLTSCFGDETEEVEPGTSSGDEKGDDEDKKEEGEEDKGDGGEEKPTKKVVSVEKTYRLTVDDDLANASLITVTYVDDQNVTHREKLTGKTWSYKGGKSGMSKSDLAMSVEFAPLDHTRACINDDQYYNVGYNMQMAYNIMYDDGSTEYYIPVNTHPLTEKVQGQYIDVALDAASCATTTSVVVENGNQIVPSFFWRNNGQGYVSVNEGVSEQEDPTQRAYVVNDNSDEFVDLDLPSGLLWCTHNVGATTPQELGGLYGWGDATGYQIDLNPYYYYTSRPTIQNISGTRYDICLSMDAASRMPTRDEWNELLNNTDMEMGECEGQEGQWRISKKNREHRIFLPASGNRYGSNIHRGHSVENRYWTATLYSGDNQAAYAMYFTSSGNTYKPGFYQRSYGAAVRAVKPKY